MKNSTLNDLSGCVEKTAAGFTLFLTVTLLFITGSVTQAVAAEDIAEPRGILELNSPETVLTVGGRINFSSYWNSPDGSFSAGGAPASKAGEDNELGIHLRNSRLWFNTRTPTEFGQIKTYIETDFYGSAGNEIATNGHAMRIRHAFFQLGGLTLGQNWSTFQTYVSPDILTDVAYIQWTRQPMARWSWDGEGLDYDLAIEQPETTLTDSSGGQVLPADDQMPDIIARLRYDSDWGKTSAAIVLRNIRQSEATLSDGTTQLTSTDQQSAWGVNLSAMFNVGEQDDARIGVIHGDGIGRYIALNAYNAGTVNNAGEITLQSATGGYAAYRHWWSNKLRSSFAYSVVSTENNLNVVPNSVNKEAYSYHINLLWTPFSDAQLGIEYAHLERQQEDSQTADMERLYIEIRYGF